VGILPAFFGLFKSGLLAVAVWLFSGNISFKWMVYNEIPLKHGIEKVKTPGSIYTLE